MKVYIVTFISLTSLLYAGAIQDDYKQTQKDIAALTNTAEGRKTMLELNLTRSLQRHLLRNLDMPDYDKATITEGNYEKLDMDASQKRRDGLFNHTYYIRYNDYVGYFIFSNDPERYYSVPFEERLIQKLKKK